MRPEELFSVIIITRGRPELLRACLESVLAAGGGPEVLVGINGADPASREALSAFPGITAVQLPGLCRGEARNELAAMARGRWLCFLDDDTLLPAGYFARLRSLIEAEPGAAVFGGGQELASGAGGFEAAVYALLASPWGGGPFTERFSPVAGTRRAGPGKFILCNLVIDRDFLRERGLAFEGHLTSAEENLLLARLAGAGAGMVLSGDLNIVHRRRTGAGAFVRQVFGSGRGRAQITFLSPDSVSLFTLLPPAALLAAAGLAFRSPRLLGLAALFYLAVSFCAAAWSRARPAGMAAVLALFPVLHISYASGWLYGAAESLAERAGGRVRPRRCRCEGKL